MAKSDGKQPSFTKIHLMASAAVFFLSDIIARVTTYSKVYVFAHVRRVTASGITQASNEICQDSLNCSSKHAYEPAAQSCS